MPRLFSEIVVWKDNCCAIAIYYLRSEGVVSQKRNEPHEVKNILDDTFSLIVLGFHKLF